MSTGLPPPIPPVPPLRATPGAVEVTRAVRLATSLVDDVCADLSGRGAPAAGAGRTAAAAEVDRRAVVGRAGAAGAALETAVRGLESFEHEVGALARRRDRLVADVARLHHDVDALRARSRLLVDAAWEAAAERAWRVHDVLVADVLALAVDERAAEAAVVRVLRGVDTVAEAEQVAEGPRPSVADLRRALVARLGRPDAVHDWWERLSAAEREALKAAEPDLVVNAAGVPSAERDDAGRVALARDLWGSTGREREGLAAVGVALGATGLLLGYRPGGDGRAVVSHGDPDTADDTVVVVPGFGTDLTSIDDLADRAEDLRDAALAQGPDDTVAAIVWLGYDAPDLHVDDLDDLLDAGADGSGVLHEDAAQGGAEDLVDFVDGLHGSDEGSPSHVTVVGHSYGSTTTAIAAAEGLDAEAVVLLGSPGVGGGADHVGDLGAVGQAGAVYVGSQDHDPVTWLGGPHDPGLGQDPAQADFGADRFDVGDGVPFHVEEVGSVGLGNHTSYFDPGSTALAGVATVVEGGTPDAVPGRDEPAHSMLGDWLAGEALHQLDQGRDWLEDRLGGLAGLGD